MKKHDKQWRNRINNEETGWTMKKQDKQWRNMVMMKQDKQLRNRINNEEIWNNEETW